MNLLSQLLPPPPISSTCWLLRRLTRAKQTGPPGVCSSVYLFVCASLSIDCCLAQTRWPYYLLGTKSTSIDLLNPRTNGQDSDVLWQSLTWTSFTSASDLPSSVSSLSWGEYYNIVGLAHHAYNLPQTHKSMTWFTYRKRCTLLHQQSDKYNWPLPRSPQRRLHFSSSSCSSITFYSLFSATWLFLELC